MSELETVRRAVSTLTHVVKQFDSARMRSLTGHTGQIDRPSIVAVDKINVSLRPHGVGDVGRAIDEPQRESLYGGSAPVTVNDCGTSVRHGLPCDDRESIGGAQTNAGGGCKRTAMQEQVDSRRQSLYSLLACIFMLPRVALHSPET